MCASLMCGTAKTRHTPGPVLAHLRRTLCAEMGCGGCEIAQELKRSSQTSTASVACPAHRVCTCLSVSSYVARPPPLLPASCVQKTVGALGTRLRVCAYICMYTYAYVHVLVYVDLGAGLRACVAGCMRRAPRTRCAYFVFCAADCSVLCAADDNTQHAVCVCVCVRVYYVYIRMMYISIIHMRICILYT